MRVCAFPDCGKKHHAKGLCVSHWQQTWRGEELRPLQFQLPNGMTPYERVMARTVVEGDCLVFTGARRHGYGVLRVGNKTPGAHQVVAEHHLGPSELHVLHSCDNPPCVRIEHLRYGTHRENIIEAHDRGRVKHPTKLTGPQVLSILLRLESGESYGRIGARFGVSSYTIRAIAKGRNWKHYSL